MYVSESTYIHLEATDALKIKCSLSERLVNSIDMEKYTMVKLIKKGKYGPMGNFNFIITSEELAIMIVDGEYY